MSYYTKQSVPTDPTDPTAPTATTSTAATMPTPSGNSLIERDQMGAVTYVAARCSGCKRMLGLESFPKENIRLNGRASRCRSCKAAAKRNKKAKIKEAQAQAKIE